MHDFHYNSNINGYLHMLQITANNRKGLLGKFKAFSKNLIPELLPVSLLNSTSVHVVIFGLENIKTLRRFMLGDVR